MSIIENTTIKRGDKLTSSDLNQQFTDVNTAFPMEGINLDDESVDLPHLNTNNSSGKSNIILKEMDQYSNTATITVNSNTVTVPPFPVSTVIHQETVLYSVAVGDLLRVYWQTQLETFVPTGGSTMNGLCWVFILEWQLSSGGAWTQVPNQGDMITQNTINYGGHYDEMYGCSLESHQNISEFIGSPNFRVLPKHNNYGQWFYEADQTYTIYGIRIVARGLYNPYYYGSKNGLKIYADAAGAYMKTYTSRIGYIQMRGV